MASAEKVSVTLTPEMVGEIRACVERGEYASASEVVRDALRAWRQQRVEDGQRLEAIRARIQRSLDDPKPNVSQAELDDDLAAFFEQAPVPGDDAAA